MGTPGGYAMNFDFSEDQKALRDQARKFLGERASPARVRTILETDAPYDTELWRGLAEMGWMGTTIPESMGGAGLGSLELCVIAEELGRSLAPTPFSSSVYSGHRGAAAWPAARRRSSVAAEARAGGGHRLPRARRGHAAAAAAQPGDAGRRRAALRREVFP